MEEMKPTVISLFAGCGGSSLGYQMAGYRELLAVEWDDNAVETFKMNFPGIPVYHGDITALSIDECMRLAGSIAPGNLDILDGSPPCQGFSTAGKRKYDDPRNSLFQEYVRLLSGLKPKVFVMENVTGMIKGYMKQAYLKIVESLRSCGYHVKGEVLNAMYYDVPQSRERVIIIGVRNDLGIKPSHPKPETKPRTFQQACYDLRNDETDLSFNQETKTAKEIYLVSPGKHTIQHHGHLKLSWNKPSPTLRKDFLGYFHYWHPDKHRPLTLLEWKRIGSFPDDFQFTDKKNGCQRIGNSVPPNLMKAIAEHIKTEILERIPFNE